MPRKKQTETAKVAHSKSGTSKKTAGASKKPSEPRGRPTAYTGAIAGEILLRLAEGETLSQICRSEHMPGRTTVLGWVVDDREGFSDRYARSRDLCLEAWADEILEVSDNGTNDWMEREQKDGETTAWAINGEHIQRSRLRVDSRKWLLSKLKPERYGDKLEVGGKDGGPIQHQVGVSWMTEEQAKARGWV